ncbi:hypothetical protein TRFO_32549 [Tritrichomonas foetus]|uniref:Cilium assembly protein DZIP1 N-terminal domain-containing protein n=1 Tax=Tritrichomonas foetus TaxID=1144522 RepID=A0A1J4JQJ3_9EUKA|nr:hypothetical protein TRFO_32549 [Tritrichomonas foetus]|eukprot:OHT00688.1 hypothetical protein TRFO_32549 [Tritrichomonas foetus]
MSSFFSPPRPQYYFAPDPVSADPNVYSQQPPQYAPTNFVQPFLFSQRVARLNFESLENVDVTQIAKTGDILSIQQLLYPIAFANITQEDATEFGSRGALHAFLILQMAVEYFIGVVNSLMTQIQSQQHSNQQKMATTSPSPDTTLIHNYEAQIALLKKDIQSRDLIIENLSDKLSDCEIERNSLKARLQNANQRERARKLRPQNDSISEGEVRPGPNLRLGISRTHKKAKNRPPKRSFRNNQSDSYSSDYDSSSSSGWT